MTMQTARKESQRGRTGHEQDAGQGGAQLDQPPAAAAIQRKVAGMGYGRGSAALSPGGGRHALSPGVGGDLENVQSAAPQQVVPAGSEVQDKAGDGAPGAEVQAPQSMIAPCEGTVTSPYGKKRHLTLTDGRIIDDVHTGVDIGNREGAAIVAAADGTVLHNKSQPTGAGNWVEIAHDRVPGGLATMYFHLASRSPLKEGEHVVQGQSVGQMGATGAVTGPHLHLEVRTGPPSYSGRTDPAGYIPLGGGEAGDVAGQVADPNKPLRTGQVAEALRWYGARKASYSAEVLTQLRGQLTGAGEGGGAPDETFCQAVALWQKNGGLTADGEAGALTLTAMFGRDITAPQTAVDAAGGDGTQVETAAVQTKPEKSQANGATAPQLVGAMSWPKRTLLVRSPVIKDGQAVQFYSAGMQLSAVKASGCYRVLFYNKLRNWAADLGEMPLTAFEAVPQPTKGAPVSVSKTEPPTSNGALLSDGAWKVAATSWDELKSAGLKTFHEVTDYLSKISTESKPSTKQDPAKSTSQRLGETGESDEAGERIIALANQYNAVPVSSLDRKTSFTVKTPYHNSSYGTTIGGNVDTDTLSTMLSLYGQAVKNKKPEELTAPYGIANGAGEIQRAFWGKGTPEGIQLVLQLAVDNGLCSASVASVEAWNKAGRAGTKYPKVGVDCSGFAYVVATEEEQLTQDFGWGNSGVFNFDGKDSRGARNFQSISPDQAKSGDNIVWPDRSHIVVITGAKPMQLAGSHDASQTKPGIELTTAQSCGSGAITTKQQFYWAKDAKNIKQLDNTAANPYPLYNTWSQQAPTWAPRSEATTHTPSADWEGGYLLVCASDPKGTTLREASGRFTGVMIPNHAEIEVRGENGTLVEIRYQDKVGWAPASFLRKPGATFLMTGAGSASKFYVSSSSKVQADQDQEKTQ